MALALELDTLSAVPEAQRGWYVQDGEKFKLDPEKVEIEDTAGLKSALEKERQAVKAAKEASKKALEDALREYEGIDPVKTRAMMAKFSNEEEAALISAGRVDEVIAKRMAKRDADLMKQVEAATAAEKTAREVAETFKGRVLDNHVRAAAGKAGIHPFAVDDALLRARTIFVLDDRGEAVQLGSDGAPILGKDGKAPFTPAEWFESMKEAAPHWFPAGGSGGGAGGDRGAGSGGKTITRAAFDLLPPAEKAKAAQAMTITD